MELLEGIASRRSVRAFKPTPIPEETLKRILQIAVKTPSYSNSQPWEVAVVTGKKKDELSKIIYELAKSTPAKSDIPLPGGWPAAMDQRVREHAANRAKTLGIERGDEQKRRDMRLANFEFYGAPCVLFLFMDSTLGSWSVFDMGLFAQTVILAAHSFGLGSCLQASVVHYPDAIRQFLGLPKTKQIVLGISIGYADATAKINTYQSTRVAADSFVHWYS